MKTLSLLSGILLSALVSGAAFAQAPAAAPAAPPPPPEVKNVGDWLVRCYPAQTQSPCDMYQQQNDAKSQQRVLAVSLAYIPRLDKHAIQISVPLGVSIGRGVVLQSGSYTSPPMPYRRCDRGGCYVEMLIDNNVVDQLNHGGDNALLKVTADDGKNYQLRISLNGFSAAHDSMEEQAKAKAKPEAGAAAAAPAKK
ncbi:MAG TPA: invasion associated locus B family protein [Rhizomicrobium sp.]|jgi:invasion protein IalB|nr:invasion associated locus B family protein [Rhizomicrobium sp.]